MKIPELEQAVKSVGCYAIPSRTGNEKYYILLPENFPWYESREIHHYRQNSGIVACIQYISKYSNSKYICDTWQWTGAWPEPAIVCNKNGEPLGVEMSSGNYASYAKTIDLLNNCNYEQLCEWLVNKIGEVSRITKEYRKKELEYHSKDYEV